MKRVTITELREKTKGIFVLVHGAAAGGWVFRDVAKLLRHYGYDVYTPTLTGLGERSHLMNKDINLDLHIQDVVNHIESYGMKDVYLVGHSYGGAIISGVVNKIPDKIKKQIYLDSFFLEEDKTILDTIGKNETDDLEKLVNEEGEGWYLPKSYFGDARGIFMKDMPWGPYKGKIKFKPEWFEVKGAYINCTSEVGKAKMLDNVKERVKEKVQDFGWEYYELNSGHAPMTKSPDREELVDILLKIAEV